jgi:hypothetical protein
MVMTGFITEEQCEHEKALPLSNSLAISPTRACTISHQLAPNTTKSLSLFLPSIHIASLAVRRARYILLAFALTPPLSDNSTGTGGGGTIDPGVRADGGRSSQWGRRRSSCW